MSELFPCRSCKLFDSCTVLQCDLLWVMSQSFLDESVEKNICPDCSNELIRVKSKEVYDSDLYQICNKCGHEFDNGSRRFRRFGELITIYSKDLLRKQFETNKSGMI